MARLLREMGFDIKSNKEVKKDVLVERKAHVERLKPWEFSVPDYLNCFGYAYGTDHCLHDGSVPEGKNKLFSAMDVLIAQKK